MPGRPPAIRQRLGPVPVYRLVQMLPHTRNYAALLAIGPAWVAAALCASATGGTAPDTPSPEVVAQVDISPGSSVFSLWLNNGVRVHIRPMPGTRRVLIAATVLGGEVLETPATRGLSQAAANAWARVDAAPEVQVARALMPEGLWLRVTAPAGAAPAAARQLGLMLGQPTIDAARLDGWKGQARLALAQRGRVARTVALEAVQSALLPADRRVPVIDSPARIDEITPPAAQAWLEECVRTHPLEIAIAGEITLAQAVSLAAEFFAEKHADGNGAAAGPATRERPSPGALRGTRDLRDAVRLEGVAHIAVGYEPEDGAPARTLVMLAFRGPEMTDLAMLRAAGILADCAAARATPRLQEAGFPTASVRGEVLPGRTCLGTGVLLLSASLAPSAEGDAADHTGEALLVLRRTLSELARDGPREEEVADLVELRIKEAASRLAGPDYWSSVLSFADCNGVPIGELGRVAEVHRSLTPQSLKATVTQLVRAHGSIEVVVRPTAPAARP